MRSILFNLIFCARSENRLQSGAMNKPSVRDIRKVMAHLGRMGRGKPKRVTPARLDQLARMRAKWVAIAAKRREAAAKRQGEAKRAMAKRTARS